MPATPPRSGLASGPEVAPVYLRPIVEEANRVGMPSAPFFRGLGFDASQLDEPGFMVSHPEAFTVVRRAISALPHPTLGLQLGMSSRLTHRGALALGILSSPTLDASIDLALRYPQSAGFLLNIRSMPAADRRLLVAEPKLDAVDLADFLVDKLFAGLVRQWRQLSETDCSPRLVELVRPPPADFLAHERHYRCPVRFNSPHNCLVLEGSWLYQPLPMANAMSLRLAEQLLAREAASLRLGSALSLAVERAIRMALPDTPDVAQVAAVLNLSERTLRRRLAAEKLSFRAMLDESRRARAMELISQGRRSMVDAAAGAGYSDPRSLRRALGRWTGLRLTTAGRDDEPGDA